MTSGGLRRKWNTEGATGLLLAAASRLPGVRAICAYTRYECAVDHGHPAIPDTRRHVLELFTSLEEARVAIAQVQDKPGLFIERFRRGDVCVVAFVGGVGVAYLWAQRGGVHHEERFGFPIPVGSDQIYYYDVFVRSEFRGEGLFPSLLERLKVHASSVGAAELCAIVEWQNRRSNDVHRRFGMKARSRHLFVNVIGRTLHCRIYP